MTNPIALDLLKLAEHYLSALHGSVARHDNIGLNLSCGGCALRDEIRDVLPKLAAAVSVPPPAPRADDQAALRDRIRRALCEAKGNGFMWGTDMLEPDEYGEVADAVLAVLPEPADRAAVCICGHTEAQHFEDACITEVTGCDCGDFLTGEAAREVIARWRDAATRKANGTDLPARLEAALTERFTELGNPFSAMRRQEQGPDGWPASHPVGPHHVAEALRELLDGGPCVAGEQQNETPEAEAQQAPIRCTASHLRVHHAPHGWEPQPGMEPIPCPGYPQPGKEA